MEESKITNKAKHTVIGFGAIAFIIIFILLIIYMRSQDTGIAPTKEFVDCIIGKGSIMYGTSWCHYCQQQKSMLSPYFEGITFVDCDLQKDECIKNNVQSYPTWKINGTLHIGLQSLQQLSDITGCSLK